MKILASVCIGAVMGVLFISESAAGDEGVATRHVDIRYTATIGDIPEDARVVDLWLPIASDTDGQTVSSVTVHYPDGGAIAVEPEYGNRIWHKRFEAPFESDMHGGSLGAEIVFDIRRTEIIVSDAKALAKHPRTKSTMGIYLKPNRLIPVANDPLDAIASELGLEGEPPIRAVRRIYDWLIDEFTYNWSAPGAGQGDVRWACDSKSGDCNDYHSMFIALCRNQGIPADHEFGYPIRSKRSEGRIPSYHCWARFFVEGVGWIPIDASEADKHPELREYNFGSQSASLFKFTHGRDVMLVPAQAGPALNKFIHPYVEIDGRAHESVKYAVYFKDLPQ